MQDEVMKAGFCKMKSGFLQTSECNFALNAESRSRSTNYKSKDFREDTNVLSEGILTVCVDTELSITIFSRI